MNKGQTKALEKLEKAMKACSDAKIRLYVASGTLLAYDAKMLESYQVDTHCDQVQAMQELQAEADMVRTFDTNLDGGDF